MAVALCWGGELVVGVVGALGEVAWRPRLLVQIPG
jgi:hypothetical protein